MGYGIVATAGTKAALEAGGVQDVEAVLKIQEGRPNAGDLMVNKDITMLMITTTGAGSVFRGEEVALLITAAALAQVSLSSA